MIRLSGFIGYAIFRRLIVNSQPEYINIPRRENDKKKSYPSRPQKECQIKWPTEVCNMLFSFG
jgi:hypothetical protein